MNNHECMRGLCKLLEIKDSDIRIMTMEQGWEAVDHGIHIGGAMSGTVPLVSLYYSGVMDIDVEHPAEAQDMFVLSKGHGVATLASVYADLGYYSKGLLKNSRSGQSRLNGHPGPLLPGVHLSTGPMGQGICVAGGLAVDGRRSPLYDVFVLTGDGELQEGSVWEAIMYAGAMKLDNLCVLVDKNEGQLDDPKQNTFPMDNVTKQFEAFGFRVCDIDGREYGPVVEALYHFKNGPRTGKPQAIICNSKKGYGAFSGFMIKHKVTLTEEMVREELKLQKSRREKRVLDFFRMIDEVNTEKERTEFHEYLAAKAKSMGFRLDTTGMTITPVDSGVRLKAAPPRNKRIEYDTDRLPEIEKGGRYQASEIVTKTMKVFASDDRVVSVDSDLGSTSGLEGGVGWRDTSRALNVGIAEANMMCIGEAFAIRGKNVWVSTFCPFFNWNVMRRIAIGQQEREEIIAEKGGWLTEGHGLDLTFLATASNFDTKTNGATHMGNDDVHVFRNVAKLRIVDVCCPRQLLEVMKWIMEGNRGLLYVRIMRAESEVVYGPEYRFEYGKGYYTRGCGKSQCAIVSSGRGVHEALGASESLEAKGIDCAVIDMPSIDTEMLGELAKSGCTLLFAEQNNGFIWDEFRKAVYTSGAEPKKINAAAVNTLKRDGGAQYIHSATYEELLETFGLAPEDLEKRIEALLR